jgi:drug/metabolite transporter (DMT)-like permease
LRYVPFIALFGAWLLLRQRKKLRSVTGADWLRFVLAGGLGVLGYHLPLNWAMSSLTPGTPIGAPTAAILVATTPLWTLIMAVAIRQERFSLPKAIGALTAFAGVALVVLRGTPGAQSVDVVDKALIAMLAPILWGGYSIIAKPLIGRYGGLFVTGLTMCLGSLAFLPFGLSIGAAPLVGLTGLEWFWLLYVSLIGTVGGYTMWNFALQRRSASEVTGYIFAIPVVATAASVLLVSARVTVWFVAGAALVIGGMVLIHRARLAALGAARPPQPAPQ